MRGKESSMTYNQFEALINEANSPEKLGKVFGNMTKVQEMYLREYCENHDIRGWKGGKLENLEAKVCKHLFDKDGNVTNTIDIEEEPTMEKEVIEETKTIDTKEEDTTMTETTEKTAEKKARKTTRKTVESMIAEVKAAIPNADLVFEENSKGTAIHVKLGKTRIFGYSGPILVVAENLTTGVDFDKKNYGCRVLPTAENMRKVYENLVAASEKKAEKKAAAEKAKAEKKAAKEAEKKTEK